MENILVFIIVVAVIGIRAIIEKKGNEQKEPELPDLSNMEMPELHYPKQQPEEGVRTTSPFTQQAGCNASQAGRKTSQAGRKVAPSTSTPLPTATEANCEFANPSPEELRRAVIWSEILQRKY